MKLIDDNGREMLARLARGRMGGLMLWWQSMDK